MHRQEASAVRFCFSCHSPFAAIAFYRLRRSPLFNDVKFNLMPLRPENIFTGHRDKTTGSLFKLTYIFRCGTAGRGGWPFMRRKKANKYSGKMTPAFPAQGDHHLMGALADYQGQFAGGLDLAVLTTITSTSLTPLSSNTSRLPLEVQRTIVLTPLANVIPH